MRRCPNAVAMHARVAACVHQLSGGGGASVTHHYHHGGGGGSGGGGGGSGGAVHRDSSPMTPRLASTTGDKTLCHFWTQPTADGTSTTVNDYTTYCACNCYVRPADVTRSRDLLAPPPLVDYVIAADRRGSAGVFNATTIDRNNGGGGGCDGGSGVYDGGDPPQYATYPLDVVLPAGGGSGGGAAGVDDISTPTAKPTTPRNYRPPRKIIVCDDRLFQDKMAAAAACKYPTYFSAAADGDETRSLGDVIAMTYAPVSSKPEVVTSAAAVD